MGIPLRIYTLHALQRADAGCRHHLLLAVTQPEFGNADAAAYDAAVSAADATRDALLRTYQRDVLAKECPGAHAVALVGEMQELPVGDELGGVPDGATIGVWVAQTRYGAPWVVLGTAPDEEAFWREVASNEDLSHLGPIRSAERFRAFFLSDGDPPA